MTLGLPPELAEALDAATGGDAGLVNGKQKWLIFSAGVLLFLDAPADVQKTIMAMVASADVGIDPFTDLIDKAKAGRLRAEVEHDLGGTAKRGKGNGDRRS